MSWDEGYLRAFASEIRRKGLLSMDTGVALHAVA
jgi:hypothetical protein